MKNLYIIVSSATSPLTSEKELWDSLRERGWAVHDIHDLPRILDNEIAVAKSKIARIVKNRCTCFKKVFIIALITTADTLMIREPTANHLEINTNIADAESIILEADAWFLEDNLLEAADSVKRFIDVQEG